jgi:hypothetical protein
MYPQLARTARIFGTVEVQVAVKDGKVVSTEVKSGPPVLAQATVENIRTWRFLSPCQCHFHNEVYLSAQNKRAVGPAESESRATVTLASENHRRPSSVGFEKRHSNYDALNCMYDCSSQPLYFGHKFTGKERDSESNLDNFSARYNSSAQGRVCPRDFRAFWAEKWSFRPQRHRDREKARLAGGGHSLERTVLCQIPC